MTRLSQKLSNISLNLKLAILAVTVLWLVALVLVTMVLSLFMEGSGTAQVPEVGAGVPTIWLEPDIGSLDTLVTVQGQLWPPGRTVLIRLAILDEIAASGFGMTNALVDEAGGFEASLLIPLNSRWEGQDQLKIIAHEPESGTTVSTFYTVVERPTEPAASPTGDLPVLPVPTITPTMVVQPPASEPEPASPQATATTDVNIRSGPGLAYTILGLLRTGQSADVTAVSPDGGWWQINFAGSADSRGWVSAKYVTTQNTAEVLTAQPPALSPPPPAPVVIRDWRGEYFNNADLNGNPALVRNDPDLNFDWGTGSPAAGLNADDFSVRWSRSLEFPAGLYRFYVRVDDGVRLWLNDRLVIDHWQDSAPTTYTVDLSLAEGKHNLKLEYYERSGSALARLTWQLLETYPDWKGEYFNNPNLSGSPALVRNDLVVAFGWGSNAPEPGLPADDFSARWSRDLYFSAGTYRFSVLVDDGARLWIDDRLIIDRWRNGEPTRYSAEITLTDGIHRLKLEYFEHRYDAQVRLDWERMSSSYPDWKAEYYDNRKLQGNPILVRNETKLDHNWGDGSPAPGLPADNFSVRWTRKAEFPAGTYLFRVRVDDGVRLWFDDTLLLDDWRDGSVRTLEREIEVDAGQHRIKVEYYERSGEARIELKWQKHEKPANQPPQARPGEPYTVDEGGVVRFDGRASRDPDGTITKYEWDLDYNGRNFVAQASGPTTSFRYQDGPAQVTVALRVTDNRGATHVGTTQVTVWNVVPVVEAGGPYAGQVGNMITLIGTALDAGLVDQTGLAYRWEFGDGTAGSGPVVSHAYAQAGTYTVRLIVTDKDGVRGQDTATVQVAAINSPPQAPEVVISGPTSGLAGEVLNFSGSGSRDRDGRIVSYIWDFGDGAAARGVDVSHRYDLAGSYRVELTVIDDTGLSASATTTMQIDQPAPVNQSPTALIDGPTSGAVGEELLFNGAGSNDSDGTIVEYRWDFGDGITAAGGIVSHIFNRAGNYPVTLTVIDDGGLTAGNTLFVQVDEVAGANP